MKHKYIMKILNHLPDEFYRHSKTLNVFYYFYVFKNIKLLYFTASRF